MLARRGVGGPTGDQRDGHRQMGGVANSGVARRGRRGVSGMCRQNEGRGGPRAWTGVMELPAVMGGFLNVTTTEGNEFMRKQIQEVLRKAGDESSDRGSAEEREDLRGVVVNTVQQLYVSVRGMRTSAATNKCEFGYVTPSGKELKWGPTRFTLYAEFHKRSLKPKTHTANTYHTVRGALILNDQSRWCELCAWSHGKGCERLQSYRADEARRTNELLTKATRETAPSRAQQQAARPEYTLGVEREKQAQEEAVIRACEATARGEEGAREALRAELDALRTQIICRDFRPHLGNCRFTRPRCKFFPCNRLKHETRIKLRDLALEEERRERMRASQQGSKGLGGGRAGPSGGGGAGSTNKEGRGGW
uniref:C3H1-type domain-containing protein n=1 Tax=Chrysotila carterae TaxID=13221 RepID=A0A7S4F5P6_CHRCT